MKVDELEVAIHTYRNIPLRLMCYVRRMLVRRITKTDFFTMGIF